MSNKILQNYLCCPICHSKFKINTRLITCSKCGSIYTFKDQVFTFRSNIPADLALSEIKWDSYYKQEYKVKSFNDNFRSYMSDYFDDVYQQLSQYKKIKNIIYLEIGCGEFIIGQAIANKCKLIIGVDISMNALMIAKRMLDKKKIRNYLLIHGDITKMPIINSSIDLIYGGGVIEHFKDTQTCVNELYRVLKMNGVCLNTVPMLNFGSLTYRQIWGNIPNFPILKNVAEFIHVRLLGSRHMKYGFEYSFLPSTMLTIHQKSGFRKVIVDRFKVKFVFEFIPKFLRKYFINLAKNNILFWPMIKIIGIK